MVNLLPCPFCGGTNVIVDYNDFEDFCVSCDDCMVMGPIVALGPIKREDHALRDTARAKAIELWNRRVPTLFGLPIVEVDDLGDASQIVFGPPLI